MRSRLETDDDEASLEVHQDVGGTVYVKDLCQLPVSTVDEVEAGSEREPGFSGAVM